jgi:hypothetical protein
MLIVCVTGGVRSDVIVVFIRAVDVRAVVWTTRVNSSCVSAGRTDIASIRRGRMRRVGKSVAVCLGMYNGSGHRRVLHWRCCQIPID